MKASHTYPFLTIFAIIFSTFSSSCDLGNNPSINFPQSPTELSATSFGPTSIRLAWKAPRTAVIGYDIRVFDDNGAAVNSLKIGVSNSAIIQGLNEGKLYTFHVMSRSPDTISKIVECSWAPASRFSGRLYVGANKQNGINFLEERTYTADKASSWDMCLEIDSTSGVKSYMLSTPFASSIADVNGMVISGLDKGKRVRKTELFNDISDPFMYTGIDSLHLLTFNAPLGAGYTPLQNLASNIQSFKRGFVLILRTQQSNYVQFHVKEKDGQIIRSDATGVYIEFEASVQRVTNFSYGKIRG